MLELADFAHTIWIVVGIGLIVLELIVPGTFVSFVGISAILTGILVWIVPLGIVTQLIICSISSFFLILIGGNIVRKIFPADRKYVPIRHNEYVNQIAPVATKILLNKKGGKIKFQGTVWDAVCLEDEISVGEYTKILSRDNLTYIVQKASQEEIENYLKRNEKNDDYITK
ncbi:MAG: NfeD family protein [Spirochaetota bacterium]